MKKRAGVRTVANEALKDTALMAPVDFHNPCPPGNAARKDKTTTECFGLPVPKQGPRYG